MKFERFWPKLTPHGKRSLVLSMLLALIGLVAVGWVLHQVDWRLCLAYAIWQAIGFVRCYWWGEAAEAAYQDAWSERATIRLRLEDKIDRLQSSRRREWLVALSLSGLLLSLWLACKARE